MLTLMSDMFGPWCGGFSSRFCIMTCSRMTRDRTSRSTWTWKASEKLDILFFWSVEWISLNRSTSSVNISLLPSPCCSCKEKHISAFINLTYFLCYICVVLRPIFASWKSAFYPRFDKCHRLSQIFHVSFADFYSSGILASFSGFNFM